MKRVSLALAMLATMMIPAVAAPAEAPATTTLAAAAAAPVTPPQLLRVAVLDFENKVPGSMNDLGAGLAEMLIRELKKTGKYTVLERAALAEVLGEQDLTRSGRVQRGQQIAVGRVKGAQLLLKGAITEFQFNVSNRNVGFGYGGVGIGGSSATARMAADIRLIDPMTGEIIEAYDEATEVKSSGMQISGTVSGFSLTAGGSENHPLGQAARQLIDRMVNRITNRLDTRTIEALMSQQFEGAIVKVESPERVVINRGFSDGVKVGDRFRISRVREELVDPQTGESLGAEKDELGLIEVTEVKERWSEAKTISGSGFDRGDLVTR